MMGTIIVNGLTGSDDCWKPVILEVNLVFGSDIHKIYLECAYPAGIYLFKLNKESTRLM